MIDCAGPQALGLLWEWGKGESPCLQSGASVFWSGTPLCSVWALPCVSHSAQCRACCAPAPA